MGKLGTYTDTGRPVAMITERQLPFLTSLTEELYRLSETITGQDLSAERDAAIANLAGMSKSAASDRISSLKGEILPTMRQTARYRAQTVEAPVSDRAPVELDTDGIYILDGTYVRIKRSGAGRLYALTLNVDTRKWEYAPGMVRNVKPADKMTAEQAKDFGDTYAWCVRCSADLTNPESVARGFGPVCAKYFS